MTHRLSMIRFLLPLLAGFVVLVHGGRLHAGARLPVDYSIKRWVSSEQLPFSNVEALVQTRDGFIWFAMNGGLGRFDGQALEVFNSRNTPELPVPVITSLLEDRDGSLWVGSAGGGLARRRDGQFQHFGVAQGLLNEQVKALCLGPDIPDNSAVGAVHAPVVSGVPGTIAALQVQLTLSPRGAEPMFNGDLFVTLSHGSGYSVLLNRVGRREGSAAGYADNGFSFTLADTAAADVHTYRQTVTGNELTPISSATPAAPLTGTWQPDGRTADPGTVLTSSPRITSLGAFTGLDPNGEWTLFVSDLGAGGLAQLDSWSLEFTVVPEPHETAALTAAALATLALARRRLSRVG